MPAYDPDSEHTSWVVRMKFDNAVQFREAGRKYSIARGLPVTFKRNEVGSVKVVCKQDCNWILYASRNPKKNCF